MSYTAADPGFNGSNPGIIDINPFFNIPDMAKALELRSPLIANQINGLV